MKPLDIDDDLARRSNRLMVAAMAVAMLLALWLLQAAPASAHAVYISSSPQANAVLHTAPPTLRIRFNERVVPRLSSIRVHGPDGKKLPTGVAEAVDPERHVLSVSLPLPLMGTYRVNWRVFSAIDGHRSDATFVFSVGVAAPAAPAPDAAPAAPPLSVAARILTLCGLALLLGLFAFRLAIWNPLFTPLGLNPEDEELDVDQARLGLRIASIGLLLLAVGLLCTFFSQVLAFDLIDVARLQVWFYSRFGAVWLIRFLLIVSAAFSLADLRAGVQDSPSARRGWEWWGGLLVSVGLAITVSLVSHSAALTEQALQATAVDLAHTLAASIWGGGLCYLGVALWRLRHLSVERRSGLSLQLFLNVSAVAAMAVGVLLLSGGYLAWQHVGAWTKLFGTPYGLTLLAKMGLAVPALGVAAVNLLVIKPRLRRAWAQRELSSASHLLRPFRWLVWTEAVFVFLVVFAAGVVTQLERAQDALLWQRAPSQTVLTETVDDLTVGLAFAPGFVGPNTFDVTLSDPAGAPVTNAQGVTLRYTLQASSQTSSGGVATGEAKVQETGHYVLDGSYISSMGIWDVEVAIRRPDVYDAFVPFRLEADLAGRIQPLKDEIGWLQQGERWLSLTGRAGTGTLLVLFAVGWIWVSTRAAKHRWQLVSLLTMALLALGVGGYQIVTFLTRDATPMRFVNNPIASSAESVSVGESVYQVRCLACHGWTGVGDGALASSLKRRPANLIDGGAKTYTDGDLFYRVREGLEGVEAHAFAEPLSQPNTWHVINYLRFRQAGGWSLK